MNCRKKIRVGVVGVGYLGRLHAQKYAMLDTAELAGVVDPDQKRAAEIAALHNTRAYGDYRELIGKVDAVSVVTPTGSHCAIGVEFLSRGIDVLMEKPISVNAEEAERLVREAEKNKAVLQVGHLERFNAALEAAGGLIKDPVYIEAKRLSPFPNRGADVDVILDLMIHDLDIVLDIVKSEVEGVSAFGTPLVSDKTDFCDAEIRFANGAVARLVASRISRERMRRMDLIQPDGTITVDYANQRLTRSRLVPGAPGAFGSLADEELQVEKKDALLEELKAFLDCSIFRKAPLVSGADGKRALELAQRVQQAARPAAVRARS